MARKFFQLFEALIFIGFMVLTVGSGVASIIENHKILADAAIAYAKSTSGKTFIICILIFGFIAIVLDLMGDEQ